MSKTRRVPAILLALLFAVPPVAGTQDTCQQARTSVALHGDQPLVFFLGGVPDAGFSLHLTLNDGGGHGGARVTDGTSNTIMIAEVLPALQCEDVNLDGYAGLTQVLLTMRNVRSRSSVAFAIVPVDGEIDSGQEQVTIAVDGRTFVDTLNVIGGATPGLRIGPRLTDRFVVTASSGQFDLGTWSKVSGLDVTLDIVEYRTGGGTITLHRAASGDSPLVKAWLEALAHSPTPTILTITQLDYSGQPIATWTFSGVFPTKWELSGPQDSGSEIAIETLVLAYEGLVLDRHELVEGGR